MNMLKRCVCLLCAVWTLLAAAVAQTQVPIECDCNASPCRCYLQLGDRGAAVRGIITRLKEQGYLPESRIRVTCTKRVETAIKAFQRAHQLPESGVFDDQTLTLLIYGVYPLDVTAEQNVTVLVSKNGGIKYHDASRKSGCADRLLLPRKVTLYNAAGLGIAPCRVCNPPVIDATGQ